MNRLHKVRLYKGTQGMQDWSDPTWKQAKQRAKSLKNLHSGQLQVIFGVFHVCACNYYSTNKHHRKCPRAINLPEMISNPEKWRRGD